LSNSQGYTKIQYCIYKAISVIVQKTLENNL
jgi:hypothetical protein